MERYPDGCDAVVLVASPLRLLRESIARVLRAHGIQRVILATEKSVLGELGGRDVDVAIVDVGRPPMLEVLKEFTTRHSRVRVLAVGVGGSDAEVLACARAGASGFLPLESGAEELMAALDSIRRDELVCTPHVAAVLFRGQADQAVVRPPHASTHLTARELEVLTLIDFGLSNKEIASRLGISLTTVKNHVHRILEKLQVSRRGAAAARARGAN